MLPFLTSKAFGIEWGALFHKPFLYKKRIDFSTKISVIDQIDLPLDAGVYTFYFTFHFSDEAEAKKGFEIFEIGKRSTGGQIKDVNGNWEHIRTGISIPLRLTVSKLNGATETIVYDKSIEQLWWLGGNNSMLSEAIDKIPLPKGKYVVQLNVLQPISELSGVLSDFEIGLPGKN